MRFSRHPAHAHVGGTIDRKSTRLNSSHGYISYAVFCLKKKKKSNVADTSHPYADASRTHQEQFITIESYRVTGYVDDAINPATHPYIPSLLTTLTTWQ